MFTSNPFAELSGFMPPAFMQTYVVIMVVLVVVGTLYDTIHKKSAKYFFKNWQKERASGARQVGGGEEALGLQLEFPQGTLIGHVGYLVSTMGEVGVWSQLLESAAAKRCMVTA